MVAGDLFLLVGPPMPERSMMRVRLKAYAQSPRPPSYRVGLWENHALTPLKNL